MSRTDKTRPHWVKTLDPYVHERYVHHDHIPGWNYKKNQETGRIVKVAITDGSCDFDPKTSSNYRRGGTNWTRDWHRCGWDLPHYYSWNHPYYRNPPAEDRRLYYWKPERNAVRMSNREMMRDWNANGDCDDDIAVVDQHRHTMYGGGWWD